MVTHVRVVTMKDGRDNIPLEGMDLSVSLNYIFFIHIQVECHRSSEIQYGKMGWVQERIIKRFQNKQERIFHLH